MASATLFTGFSIGTALAPNLASFFVFRILTAFQGTAFLIIGSAVIGDIYKPVSCASFIAVLVLKTHFLVMPGILQ
jgi:MFS family permease